MTTTPAHIPIAMVGVGGFGGYRRQLLRATGRFRLVAAYDRNPEALAACVAEEGCTEAASFEALLATPGIRALVISTGAGAHCEQALAAMDRGLHVFIEKPLCVSAEEMRALIAAQKRTGVVVGLGHHAHDGETVSLAMKRVIDSGELGKLVAVEATTCHTGSWHIKPGDWRGQAGANPGGMLFQCGVHKLHELMWLLGPIREVACFQRFDINDATETADAAQCLLRFESGLLATLNAYHVSPYTHTISVFGSRGNLHRDDRYFDEGTRLVVQRTDLNNRQEPQVPVPITGSEDALVGVTSWAQAIADGGATSPTPSLLDGARAVAVVFAAEESHRRGGAPVAIAEILATAAWAR